MLTAILTTGTTGSVVVEAIADPGLQDSFFMKKPKILSRPHHGGLTKTRIMHKSRAQTFFKRISLKVHYINKIGLRTHNVTCLRKNAVCENSSPSLVVNVLLVIRLALFYNPWDH